MTWQDVKGLEDLAQLNLKLNSDALDDAIEYLVECQQRLEKALGLLREYNDEYYC